MQGPGSPNRGGPSQSPLLATVSAPCVQLEVRQLGSREECRAPAPAGGGPPTTHHPPREERWIDGSTEPSLRELSGRTCSLPSSLPLPRGPHALITSIALPSISACNHRWIALTFYFEIIFNLQRISKIQSSQIPFDPCRTLTSRITLAHLSKLRN